MQCKTCFKMFTPTAKKIITEICDQCDKRISQNDSKNTEKSFENMALESKKYYKKQMDAIDIQIKNIGQIPNHILEKQSNFENQEKSLSTIERLKKYKNSHEPKKISKKVQLENLKKKYPFVKTPFNKFRDRDQFKQYWPLTGTKNFKITEFVLKWESVHGKRIHKDMAQEILTDKKKMEISDEYLEKIYKKYEHYG